MSDKICPLNDDYYCYEDCPWYDKEKKQCAILSIAKSLKILARNVGAK